MKRLIIAFRNYQRTANMPKNYAFQAKIGWHT